MSEVDSGWDRRRTALLGKYERVAWKLFATRGFQSVTVDEVAEAAGVSARTLFRYFPTKEDYLLRFPRQGTDRLLEKIADLEPRTPPLEAVWGVVRAFYLDQPPELSLLTLWRRAAADAPEIHARVRGERVQALTDSVAAYCAASLQTDSSTDPRPRLLAGVIVGVEGSVVDMWGRSQDSIEATLDAAERTIPGLSEESSVGTA